MTQLSLLVKSCQGHRYNQTDPPSPSLLKDGENGLNIALNNPGVEGRVLTALLLQGGCMGSPCFEGCQGPGRAFCKCLRWGALLYVSSLPALWCKYSFPSSAQQALGLRCYKNRGTSSLSHPFNTFLFCLLPPTSHCAPNISMKGMFLCTVTIQFFLFLCRLIKERHKSGD